MRRRRNTTEDHDHSRCHEALKQASDRQDRLTQGIEQLLKPHKPYPDPWAIRPGNSAEQIHFYCERCRTPWPCQVFNDLRWLYGEVNDWPQASRPYERLTLHLSEPRAEEADDA